MLKMFFWLGIATWGLNAIGQYISELNWIFWLGSAGSVIGLIGVAREIYSKDKQNGKVKKPLGILEKKV